MPDGRPDPSATALRPVDAALAALAGAAAQSFGDAHVVLAACRDGVWTVCGGAGGHGTGAPDAAAFAARLAGGRRVRIVVPTGSGTGARAGLWRVLVPALW